MIEYQEFEEYVREEIIRDRGFFNPTSNHFLRTLNQALLEFARDLNTIDTDYYYEEVETGMTEGVPVNLGESLGFSGGVLKNGLNSFNNRTVVLPRLKKGNKGTAFGLVDYYDKSTNELMIEFVNNTEFPTNLDLSKVILQHARKPAKLTGSPGTEEIDIPEQGKYPLAVLMRYYYYYGRQFYSEADRDMLEYRDYMNKYVKKGRPSVYGSEMGKPFVNRFNNSSFITFR